MSSEVHWTMNASPLGPVVVAASEAGVCWLAFEADASRLKAHYAADRLVADGPYLTGLLAPIAAAIQQPSPAMLAIPLDAGGTPFQQRVWEALRAIPLGETRTYGELAATFGKPGAARAIGGANAANRIAVLIPCHRVIAADGTLGGYAWGLEVKAELLRREGARITLHQPSLL